MSYTQEQDQAGDERLFVKFYMGVIENPAKALEVGHPVFDEVPFVRIMVPGDKNTVIDTAVSEMYKARFPRLWKQFSESQQTAEQLQGLPIREWPAITRAQAEELAYLNILTVEQLAHVADSHGSKIMGFSDLKRKATTYLEQAKDNALSIRLTEENKNLQDQITSLKAQLDEQSKVFDEMRRNSGRDNNSGGGSNRSK